MNVMNLVPISALGIWFYLQECHSEKSESRPTKIAFSHSQRVAVWVTSKIMTSLIVFPSITIRISISVF